MKNTFVPELKKTPVRKVLDSLVERIREIEHAPISNHAYCPTYKDIAFEDAERELQKLRA